MRRTKLELQICKAVRDERKDRSIPQTTFCQILGISQATLSKIENKETVPSVDAWIKFCRAFEVSPDPGHAKGVRS